MRREDERFVRLVDALDVDGQPLAETWRLVGAAAAAQGLLRPSYAHVRRLALARRDHEQARMRAQAVLADAASLLLTGRVPDVYALADRLEAALND